MIAHYLWVAAAAVIVALAVVLVSGTMLAVDAFDRSAAKR